MKHLFLGALAALLLPLTAYAQTAVVTNPPVTVGNIPTFTDTFGTVVDSGVIALGGNLVITDPVGGGSMTFSGNNLTDPNHPVIYNNSPGPVLLTRFGATSGADDKDFYIFRNANYSGGAFGNTATALTVATNVAAGAKTFEWNFLAELNNSSVIADNSQNVAAYFLSHKLGTAPTWGAVTELVDHITNPAAGSVTDEHDMSATGTDNNNSRVLFDGWVRNAPGLSAPVEAAYAIRLNTDTNAKWKHGIYFNGIYGDGINLSPGTYDGNNALVLGASQNICFDGPTCSIVLAGSGGTLSTLSSISAAGQISGISLVSAGNITLNPGSNFCLSTSCANWLTYDTTSGQTRLGNLVNGTVFSVNGGGDVAARNFSASQALAAGATVTAGGNIVSTAGDFVGAAGKHLCLDGACSSWITYDSGSGQWRVGNTVHGTVFSVDGSGNVVAANNLNATGITGTSLSAGTGAVSGGTGTFSGTVQAPTLQISSGNGWSVGSSRLAATVGGNVGLTIDSSGNVVATTSVSVGLNPGVSCAAGTVTLATLKVTGGIVTHC